MVDEDFFGTHSKQLDDKTIENNLKHSIAELLLSKIGQFVFLVFVVFQPPHVAAQLDEQHKCTNCGHRIKFEPSNVHALNGPNELTWMNCDSTSNSGYGSGSYLFLGRLRKKTFFNRIIRDREFDAQDISQQEPECENAINNRRIHRYMRDLAKVVETIFYLSNLGKFPTIFGNDFRAMLIR